MASHIRTIIPRAVAVFLAVFMAGLVVAAQTQDLESKKIEVVKHALVKLQRSPDNKALIEAAKEACALTDIKVLRSDSETQVVIDTDGEPLYRHFVLEAQNSLVVDFYNTINLRHNETFEAPDSPVVKQVRTSMYKLDPQFVSRVVIDMKRLPEMRVDRIKGGLVVHVPDGKTLPQVEPAVPTAQSVVITGLKNALNKQRAQVTAAEAKLKAENKLRVQAEKKLKDALAAKSEEVQAAIETEQAELAKAQKSLEDQIAQRESTETKLRDKLASTQKELAEAVASQKKAIDDAQKRLEEKSTQEQQTKAQYAETKAEIKRQQDALAKLESELAAARAERDKVESSLRKELTAKEEEARTQIEDRQKALADLTAKLEKERSAKEDLAAKFNAQAAEKAKAAQTQLNEQKDALAKLEKELDAAHKKIEAEESAKSAFETKLADRERELNALIEKQNATIEQSRDKLAKAAKARTQTEEQYKQQLAAARSASEAKTAQLKQTVADYEKQLDAERQRTAQVEQDLKAQLAKRDQEQAAAIAELENRLKNANQTAKAQRTEILAAQDKAAHEKISALQKQIDERDQKLADLEKKLTSAEQPSVAPAPSAEPQSLKDIYVTLTFRNADLKSVLDILARRANINILAGSDVKGEVTARFNNVPLMLALDVVLRDNGYDYVIENNIYRIVPADYPQGESMKTEFVRLKNANAADVQATLENLASPNGSVVANASANAVVLVDTQRNVERLKSLAMQLDSTLEGGAVAPGEAGLVTKSFSLKKANVADVSKTIEQMLSPQGKVATNESANVLIVTDHAERISEIEQMLAELDVAQPVVDVLSGIFQLSYANATEVAKVLKEVVTQDVGSVIADERTNQVIVTDTPSNFDVIKALIPELDQRVPQVYIQVMMVDVVLNDDAQYGVKWLANAVLKQSLDLKNLSVGSSVADLGKPATPSMDATEISFGVIGNDINLQAVIQAEVQDRDAKILATPDIQVLDNRQAQIEIVSEVPFQEITQTTQGPPVSSTEFKDIGVTLTVRPQITHDRSIILEMSPEESSISGYSESGIPIEDSRRASTTLLVNDGSTVYIGGLRNVTTGLDVSKVPVLGDIPYVGYLFRNSKTSDHRTELMVFLTARILDNELPGLTPDEQRTFDQMGKTKPVPDATRDLIKDIKDPSGVREPLWKWHRSDDLPKTK